MQYSKVMIQKISRIEDISIIFKLLFLQILTKYLFGVFVVLYVEDYTFRCYASTKINNLGPIDSFLLDCKVLEVGGIRSTRYLNHVN